MPNSGGEGRGAGVSAGDFLCEEIEVETEGQRPVALVWRGERHEIAEVLRMWYDVSFGSTPPRGRKAWWQRRHRTCYRVATKAGERLEIYWDRGSIGRKWFISRRWKRPVVGQTQTGGERE
ncbi:MAG: DUF6504 family protein [Armatimonadota bacterium]